MGAEGGAGGELGRAGRKGTVGRGVGVGGGGGGFLLQFILKTVSFGYIFNFVVCSSLFSISLLYAFLFTAVSLKVVHSLAHFDYAITVRQVEVSLLNVACGIFCRWGRRGGVGRKGGGRR